jgi:hypothetical protein
LPTFRCSLARFRGPLRRICRAAPVDTRWPLTPSTNGLTPRPLRLVYPTIQKGGPSSPLLPYGTCSRCIGASDRHFMNRLATHPPDNNKSSVPLSLSSYPLANAMVSTQRPNDARLMASESSANPLCYWLLQRPAGFVFVLFCVFFLGGPAPTSVPLILL